MKLEDLMEPLGELIALERSLLGRREKLDEWLGDAVMEQAAREILDGLGVDDLIEELHMDEAGRPDAVSWSIQMMRESLGDMGPEEESMYAERELRNIEASKSDVAKMLNDMSSRVHSHESHVSSMCRRYYEFNA